MCDRPKLAITVGDPNGIGPEVILKSLAKKDVANICRPIIIAPMQIIRREMHRLQIPFDLIEFDDEMPLELLEGKVGVLNFEIDCAALNENQIDSVWGGKVAGTALNLAVNGIYKGVYHALVTAPISKSAFKLAGFDFPGHTEFLAFKSHCQDVVMVLLSDAFRVGLVTTHCPLAAVPKSLSTEIILRKLRVLDADLNERFNIPNPRIAVLALNPHAGEGGLLGKEEIELIAPAIEQANESGMRISGPFPADSIFTNLQKNRFDAFLAMYHDQGLIPLKMSSFGKAVNYTAGLPFIRTSPDHGTAFDIAGKGVANSESMEAAIKLATRLATKQKNS
ncbi:MAG: 4-hydroxythreonine-4-phosphate dehydrogenase PdxA [bacterium]